VFVELIGKLDPTDRWPDYLIATVTENGSIQAAAISRLSRWTVPVPSPTSLAVLSVLPCQALPRSLQWQPKATRRYCAAP
jgi:hypothetical protein